jgi:hypothetical protein
LAEDFSWFFDGVNSKHAAFNIGDLRLYPFDGSAAYTNFITLKSPTALASNYSLTLPTALPANTLLLQTTSGGQISYSNTISQPILGASGSASAPTFGFSGDTNTGMYSSAADTLDWSTGGTVRLRLRTDYLLSTLPFQAATGSAAAPSLTFSADPDTGLWNQTTNTLGFTTAGVQRLSLSTTALTSTVGFSGTTGTFSGAVSASTYGNAVASSLNLDGGGAFKVKIITSGTGFTVGAGGTSNRDLGTHGLTLSSIRGIISGATDDSGVRVFGAVNGGSFPYPTGATANSTNVFVTVANDSGSSNNFTGAYVVIFYV